MKKTLLGIAGILAIISVANAADTDKIKAACQASDKTLWVESNQVCIPKNPCKNEKYEAYCNRDFSTFRGVKRSSVSDLIKIYTKVNKYDCGYGPSFELFDEESVMYCNEDNYTMVFQLSRAGLGNENDKYNVYFEAINFLDLVCDKIFNGRCEKTEKIEGIFKTKYVKYNIDNNLCSIIKDNSLWAGVSQDANDPCNFFVSYAYGGE